MSDKVAVADNQQGRLRWKIGEPSETIRQTPRTKLEIVAYLNGAIHDASLNKGKRIRFVQKNKQWLKNLQLLLQKINCNSWIYKEGKDRNVYVLETLCKGLEFGLDPICLKTKNEKKFYAQGFFDAEGGIPRTNGRFYIQLAQKNQDKIGKLKRLLEDLGIESGKIHNPSWRVDPNYWRIFILTRDHKKFAEIVNSSHPIKTRIFRERMKI